MQQIFKKVILLFMFKCKNSLLPVACNNLIDVNHKMKFNQLTNKEKCQPNQTQVQINLRCVYDFNIPKYWTNLRAKCLKVLGAKLLSNFKSFKREIHKTILG